MADWIRTDDEALLRRTPAGRFGLLVVGLLGCQPCDLLKENAERFRADHPDGELLLFKVDKSAWPGNVVSVHGKPLRHFPTTIGFVGGEEVFRMEGAAIKRDDAALLERRFERAHRMESGSQAKGGNA